MCTARPCARLVSSGSVTKSRTAKSSTTSGHVSSATGTFSEATFAQLVAQTGLGRRNPGGKIVEVTRLGEPEAVPVEPAGAGLGRAVDLWAVRQLKHALEADALVADALIRPLVRHRDPAHRGEVLMADRVTGVGDVEHPRGALVLA